MTDIPDEFLHARRFENERWRAHERSHDRERNELDRTAEVMREKLNEMNNLRQQITEERSIFAAREVVDQQHATLMSRMDQLVDTLRTQTLTTQAEQNRRIAVMEPKVASLEAILSGSTERAQRITVTESRVTSLEKTVVKLTEFEKRVGLLENKMSNYEGRMAMLSVVFLVLTVAINIALRYI